MKNRIYAASYERAVELKEAGCPVDYLDALPHSSFRAEKLPGYVESRVYAFGPLDTRYVIALRLASDRGTVITDWSFDPPWKNHAIVWDYEPGEIIPKKHQEVYKSLIKSRLTGVLNERRLIRRGYPVDGVICGRSFQSVGEFSHGFVSAKLSFTDDLGNTVPLCIELNVDTHSYSSASRLLGGKVCHRPLDIIPMPTSAISSGPYSESVSLRGDAGGDQPSLSQGKSDDSRG